MPELTLYTYPFRSRAERIKWILDELGLPYQQITVEAPGFRSQELLKHHAAGKVPVLLVDGKAYTESLAIMEYLATRFDLEQTLIPSDIESLYVFRQLISFLQTEIESYLWVYEQARWIRPAEWPEGTKEAAKAAASKGILQFFEIPAVIDYFNKSQTNLSANTGLIGQFSLLDILAYQILTWAAQAGIALPMQASAYFEAISQRSAFPESMRYVAKAVS